MRPRRLLLWSALLAASLALHFALSWQAGRELGLPGRGEREQASVAEIRLAPQPPEPEREELVFEEPPALVPPAVLLASTAAVAPPPNVNLALRAAAGAGSEMPMPAPAQGFGLQQARGMGAAGFGTGIGNGLSNSSNRFAAYVQGLRDTGLDVVFVIDATGSMDWVLAEVRKRVADIADATRSLVPLTRFGVVAYRDRDDPRFVVREQPLTFSLAKLARFVEALRAEGGGSWQEAVDAGLEAALNRAGWRPGAKRVVLLIGDAPPHEKDMERTLALAREFARVGGEISVLDVSNDANPALIEASLGRKVNRALYRERPMLQYESIAEAGGGTAATMDGDIRIARQLVSLIMGGQFSAEMSLLLESVKLRVTVALCSRAASAAGTAPARAMTATAECSDGRQRRSGFIRRSFRGGRAGSRAPPGRVAGCRAAARDRGARRARRIRAADR